MDNQFTQTNKGLMSFFENSMPSFNRMLKAANLTIKIEHEEDYTVIPVSIVRNGEVSYEIETGIRTFCNHLEVALNNCTECGEFVEQDCF